MSSLDILGIAKLAEVANDFWARTQESKKLKEVLDVLIANNIDPSQLKLSYEGAGVKLSVEGNDKNLTDNQIVQVNTLIKSYLQANLIKYLKEELNLRAIIDHAKTNFTDNEHVSSEPLDVDWKARFENYAKNINSEYMQKVWGKVLAGKLKNSGCFSLRSLDTLRNLSKDDAEKFAKFCNYLVCDAWKKRYFIFNDQNFFIEQKLDFDQLINFDELGLFNINHGLTLGIFKTTGKAGLIYADKKLIEWNGATFQQHPLRLLPNVVVLTDLGKEIAKLVGDITPNEAYIKLIYKLLKGHAPKTDFYISDILRVDYHPYNILQSSKTDLANIYQIEAT